MSRCWPFPVSFFAEGLDLTADELFKSSSPL